MPIGSRILEFLRTHPPLRSRWPLLALGLASLTALLAPLLFDLFFVIPWPIRKQMGRAGCLVLVALGVRRLLQVRPDDTRPVPEPEGGVASKEARWLPWALQLAVSSLVLAILRHRDGLGFGDWDHNLQYAEAVRRTIADWHQFPWWTPWGRGGFPLASEPECGVASFSTLLVLWLGTSIGLRVTAVLCLMIGVEGARRLAWYWFRDPWAAAAAGLVYGINGAVLTGTVALHLIPMSCCVLPWLVEAAFRIGERFRSGVWLGFWTAFDLLNGIQYPSIYALVIAGLAWLRAFRLQPAARRGALLAHTVAAAGVCLALAGWRIATTALVLRDYPRVYSSMFGGGPSAILAWLLGRPGPEVLQKAGALPAFWESAAYVGPLVLLLAAASLRRGWRWWHALALICLWLCFGSFHWTQPSYWLSQVPVFSTMHVVTRWRFVAMLGIAMSVASLLARWRSVGGLRRALVPVVVVAIGADYLAYGHAVLPVAACVRPVESVFPGPPTAPLVNVEDNLGFAAILRGYGVIRSHEALLGYDRNLPTARLWKGHPDYVGEAWVGDRRLDPVLWSPNRIVFQAEPGQEIGINQNPGSWWRVNGRIAAPSWRCAEWLQPFTARADAHGRLELEIDPKGRRLGIGLHVAGVGLVVLALAFTRISRRPGTSDRPEAHQAP